MLITHDMGVIAEACDRVGVMYAGRLVEVGAVQQVIHAAHHPYSRGLMASIPSTDVTRERLHQIPGSMPRLTAIPSGCAFHPRCERVSPRCLAERPVLTPSDATLTHHPVACWHPLHANHALSAEDSA